MPKLLSLARLSSVALEETLSGAYLRGVSRMGEFGLDVHGALNVEGERERLRKEISKTQAEIDGVLKKLNTPDFVARAPEAVVAENRQRHGELCGKLRKLESSLNHLPQD